MNATAIVGVLTAIIAASVALIGYVINQMTARRERRAKAYAEALRTIRQYQEIPYRVVRRLDSSAETRTRLDDQHGEIMSSIGFHIGWLRLESPDTAAAYEALWERYGGLLNRLRTSPLSKRGRCQRSCRCATVGLAVGGPVMTVSNRAPRGISGHGMPLPPNQSERLTDQRPPCGMCGRSATLSY
ncbi:hypothetical protein AB0H49_33025 [Nocardia sp. NPDC050713]|uniref:hypothetical protein n=1 Tax=Nocardia sp. NPDC050713 TaxID=3154511 RepID=UPI0033F9347A